MVDSKKSVLRPQMANVPDGFKRAVGYEGQVNWLAAASKQAMQTSGEAFEAAKNAIQVASDALEIARSFENSISDIEAKLLKVI